MIGNRILTTFSNIFSDLNLTDMETCYKAFRREVYSSIEIEENRFGFEPEVTAKVAEMARKENIRIYEVGISYYGRTYEEGKKIGAKDGIRALMCIYIFNNSNFATKTKYLLNGLLIALSQLLIIISLVELLRLGSITGQNLVNIISLEISLLISFFLHSKFTWRQRFQSVKHVILSLFKFELKAHVVLIIRIIIFYLLSKKGLYYIDNVLIGIAIAVVLNPLIYKNIFNKLSLARKNKRRFTRGGGLMENFLSEQRAKMALRLINRYLKERDSVLDIGCGLNPLFLLLATNFKNSYGIDKLVKDKIILEQSGRRIILDNFKAKESNLPFDHESMDAICMLAFIEHIDRSTAKRLLAKSREILRKDGVLIITTPSASSDKLLRFLSKVKLVSSEEIDEHIEKYTRTSLVKLLKEAGFENQILNGSFELGANLWALARK
jgi:SAM-dependent methyltransferase/putative flippase GtrA